MNSQGSSIYEINLIDTRNSCLHRNDENCVFYACESPIKKKKGKYRRKKRIRSNRERTGRDPSVELILVVTQNTRVHYVYIDSIYKPISERHKVSLTLYLYVRTCTYA